MTSFVLFSGRQPLEHYRVVTGEHDNRNSDGFEQEFAILNYTLHPQYKGTNEDYSNTKVLLIQTFTVTT